MDKIEEKFFEAFRINKVQYMHEASYKTSGLAVYKAYPPITPEIVLGLEEILGTFHCGTLAFKTSYWYQLPIDHIWVKEHKNNTFYGHTRIEALLKLLIEYKDEIQDQVKELFNGK